jgi:hypothetical protein
MKMKKTQSLKLMLLGLFSLVSTGVWAQYAVQKGVVYHTVDGKAYVAGVIESVLPTEFDGTAIRTVAQVGGVDVVGFESGWKTAQTLSNKPSGNAEVSVDPTETVNADGSVTISWSVNGTVNKTQDVYRTADATAIEGLVLILDGAELKEISRNDIDGLQIAKFIVAKGSGITEIPENLFAMTTKVRIENPENAANQQAIADAQAIIDGYDEYYITDGQYDGKQVYVRTTNSGNKLYYIVDAEVAVYDNDKFCNPAKRLDYDADKQTVTVVETGNNVYVDGDDLKFFTKGAWKVIATAFDGNAYPKSVTGKQAEYDAAVAAEDAAKQAYEEAKAAYEQAIADKVLPNHEFSEEQLAKKAKAEALRDAIAAFEDYKTKGGEGYQDVIVPKIQEYTNVTNVSTWWSAYTLATQGVDIIGFNNQTNKANLQKLVDNFTTAYTDLFGVAPTAIEGLTYMGYGMTAYEVDANLVENGYYNAQAEPAVQFTGFGDVKVKDGNDDQDSENEQAYIAGLNRVTIMGGASNGVNYYVNVAPGDQAEGAYYQLFVAEDGSDFTPYLPNGRPIVVQFGEGQELALVPTGGNQAVIDSADPAGDIEEYIKAATPKSDKELQDAVDAAEAAKIAAEGAWETAQAATKDAKKALDDAKQDVADATEYYNNNFYTNEYRYNPGLQNETLVLGSFLNGIITSIGDHAFANCVNAKFAHTFPATIEYVGEEAFLNTQFANADFSTATSEDLFISEDAFAGTPLKKLMLNGTTSEQITPELVRTIVASIAKADEDLEIVFCNDTKTLAAGEYNTTLTTVTLPEGEYYTAILKATFDKCWGLTSVMIPATITDIQVQAFRFTNVDKFDLTANTGLFNVGKAAFAWNPSLTSVKFAPEAEMTSLEKTTFWGACALNEVVFNDAMTLLPEGLFSTNALAELNLCNTNVQVLYNLFLAGPGPDAIYPEAAMPNTTLESVCLPEGLVVIKRGALAYMHNANFTDVEIPGNVIYMEDDVLRWCANLKTVTIMDSRMIGLPPHTFAQDANLEKLTFITLNTINPNPFGTQVVDGLPVIPVPGDDEPIVNQPYTINADGTVTVISEAVARWGQCFGDNIFFACTKRPLVEVGLDSYNKLIAGETAYAPNSYDDPKTYGSYSKLVMYEPTIELSSAQHALGSYWRTYQSKYGTWIKAEQGVIVYSAYQDGHKIIMYPAKIKGGYYKIAAYNGNNDAAAAAVIRSKDTTIPADIIEMHTNASQKYQTTLDTENQLLVLKNEVPGTGNLNFYYLSAATGQPQFYQTVEPVVLPVGYVCFMTTAEGGQGSRLDIEIVDENEATSIMGVKDYVKSLNNSDVIFNMQGVRVNSTVKGQLYIKNGQKFIQK